MNQTAVVCLLFFLGTLLGAFGLIHGKITKKDFFKIIVLAGLSLVLGSIVFFLSYFYNRTFFEIELSLALSTLIFASFFTGFYRNSILPEINELLVLAYTTAAGVLLYFFRAPFPAWLLFGLPAYVVIVISFIPVITTARLRLFLYSWYLLLLVVLSLYAANLKVFISIFEDINLGKTGYFHAFLGGGLFIYLFVHFIFLYKILPIRSANESLGSYITRRSEYLNTLVRKYSPHQHHFLVSLIVMAGTFCIFWLNNSFNIVSRSLLITLFLVFVNSAVILSHQLFEAKSIYTNSLGDTVITSHKYAFKAWHVLLTPILAVMLFIIILGIFWPDFLKSLLLDSYL